MVKIFVSNNKYKIIEVKRSQCGQIISFIKLVFLNFLKKKFFGNGVVVDVENEGIDFEE